jgi:hypothetical protein
MGIGLSLHMQSDTRRRDEMSAARASVRAACQVQRRQRQWQRQQDDQRQRRASQVARPSPRIPDQP